MQNFHQKMQLFMVLVARDLQTRYSGSLLGVSWTQFYPLLILSVYWFVFTNILPSPVDRFPIFLFTGIILWNFFSSSIQLSSNCLLASSYLVKNLRFPIYLLVLSAIATAGIDLATSHIIVLVGAIAFGVTPSLSWLSIPLVVLLLAITTVGLGLALSAVCVFFRDVKFFVDVTMTLLIFVTPVFYSTRMVPASLQWLIYVNPLATAITAYRQAFLEGDWPSGSLLVTLAVVATVSIVGGRAIFGSTQRRVIDVL